MYSHSVTFWQQDYLKDFFIPVIIAVITYILFKKIDDWKNRRTNSTLGVLIIESLIEEVGTGLTLMNDVLDTSKTLTSSSLLPDKSWTGMSTISDEVLLRIIQTSKKITPDGFPPRQIRSHCKNYFYNITSHWKSRVISGANWRTNTTQLLINDKFLEATQKVLAMLEQTKSLLDKNSRRIFPK